MRHLVYKYCNICNQEYDVLFRYTSLVRYICGFPHHLVNSRLCDSVSMTGTENNFDYWCYVWRWNPECQVKLKAFVQASRAVDCLVMWLEQFIRRWNYVFFLLRALDLRWFWGITSLQDCKQIMEPPKRRKILEFGDDTFTGLHAITTFDLKWNLLN